MRVIQTRYEGYHFRSRLEARWAVYFDYLGLKWEYEVEGFEFKDGTRYLPDFWLPDFNLWVEVKGVLPESSDHIEVEKLIKLRDTTGCAALLVKTPDVVGWWVGYEYIDGGGCFSLPYVGGLYDTTGVILEKGPDRGYYFCNDSAGNVAVEGRVDVILEPLLRAQRGINAFRSARFEFGDSN